MYQPNITLFVLFDLLYFVHRDLLVLLDPKVLLVELELP